MTGRVEGKVAFITGAARGQGRSHAVTLAREGADIIAVDITAQIGTVPYPMATPEDLAQTVKEVEAAGRRIVATAADVRDYDALKEALDDGVARLGRLDIVSANAGIVSYDQAEDLPEQVRETRPAEISASLYEEAVESAKRQVVLKAFDQANYDHETAAKILGLHPNYLHKLIRTMDLRAVLKRAGR